MRLIDKDALLEKLGIAEKCEVCTQNNEPYCRWKPDVVDVCEIISDAPTIEPEKKKGKWIDDELLGQYRCSECDYYSIDEYDFCPSCGCSMEGDEE